MRYDVPFTLLAANKYEVYTRMLVSNVQNAYASYSDYSQLGGKDMLIDATWGEEIDQQNGHGSFIMFRERRGGINISPLMNNRTGKPWPYVHAQLETSIVPKGSGGPGSWMNVFQGYLMNINIANDEKSISADAIMGGRMAVRHIWPQTGGADLGKTSLKFGAVGGRRLDLVMQDIIDYLFPFGAFDNDILYAPDIPNFYLNEYPQALVPAMEGLTTLANMIGWDFRYRYDSAGLFRPTLIKIERDIGTIPHMVIPESQMLGDIKALNVDGTYIRTLVEMYDSARNFYYRYAPNSSDYGEASIPMRLVEDKTFGIDTADEANALLDAVVYDVSEPPLTHAVEIFYNPLIQLNDIHTYIPNSRHYSDFLNLAVAAVEHHINVDTQRTTVSTRGRPAAAHRRWLEGKPKMIFPSLTDAVGTAPEGAEWYKLISLDFPA